METTSITEALRHGDRVTVRFTRDVTLAESDVSWRGREATGVVTAIVHLRFIGLEAVRGPFGMPPMLEVKPDLVENVAVLETQEKRSANAKARARGAPVFHTKPAAAAELRSQLTDLAEMIAARDHDQRRRELMVQFNEIADMVELAETKRNYLLTKARLGVGDFNPAYWTDERVYRIRTVAAIPADFELDRAKRTDRKLRLEQAVRQFGERERDVRRLRSFLNRNGWPARRLHPNGFDLIVTIATDPKLEVEARVSPNGFWTVSPRDGSKRYLKRVQTAWARDRIRTLNAALGAFVEQL